MAAIRRASACCVRLTAPGSVGLSWVSDETILHKIKQYSLRGGTYEFKSRATQREWDGDCPSVRTVCARSFLSIRCRRSFWPVGAIWREERILGNFRSFRGVHGRGDVSLPQFMGSAVCVGSYRRGDTLRDIAYRWLQNTNGLRPLRS